MLQSRRFESLWRILPRGEALPTEVWRARHRGIVGLLWAHAVAIPVFGLVRGLDPWHTLLESLIVPAAALAATSEGLSRRVRTVAASAGLLSSSAVLVHMSGGVIEMHFHFFVMVTVVALYQDWLPFLAAIAYVFVHHGLVGALDPESVFNHRAALEHPWRWAGIHALFISGISATCLVTWRLNEATLGHRRRAEARVHEEARIVETLHEVGTLLASQLDLERVAQTVTDAATERTNAEFGAFFYNVVDAGGESFLLYTLSGAPIDAFAGFGLPRNTPIFEPTFSGRTVVRLDDVTKDPRYGHLAPHHGMPAGHLPVRSYLAVPVRSRGGGVLGGLFFGHPAPGRFTEADERIVVGIASQAAIALDNARLYESERQARVAAEAAQRRLGLLVEVSRVLSASFELDTIIRELAAVIAPAFAEYCMIDLCLAGGTMTRVVGADEHARGGIATAMQAAPPEGRDTHHPVVQALRDGETRLLDGDDAARLVAGVGAGPDDVPVSAIVVPLAGRDEVLGALTLARTNASAPFGHDDVTVAGELARRAGVAIENARLYARQRTVAETLQHSLLPERLPTIPGIEAASRYVAGGPGVDVGGDWYDLLQLPAGRVLIAMGDVVGRGERAAALMGQLRNAVRAYALDVQAPATLVARLNDLLHGHGPGDMATMICAVLDLADGALTIANAGHPPPIAIAPDGTATLLEGRHGPPVGAVNRARYSDWTVRLEPGTTLMLYTDGLVENRTTPLQDGLERVRRSVSGVQAGVEHLCERALAAGVGGETQDDVAILMVRLLPLGDRLSLRLPTEAGALEPLRATLRRWLGRAGATADETYEILVAAGEACTNAIRHTRSSGSQAFEIDASVDGEVCISVRDDGGWRAPRADGGGRGLGIMDAFMDDVDVATGVDGTTVTMRRRLTRPAGHGTSPVSDLPLPSPR